MYEWVVEVEAQRKEFEFRFMVDGAPMLSEDYPTIENDEKGTVNAYLVS